LFSLDTTVLIDHLRGAPAGDRVDDLLDRGDLACTTAINVEEVVRGLRNRELKSASSLIEGLIVIPLQKDEGWQAGVWRRDFAARGITLSQADCLIAAAALSAEAALVTGNPKDFPMKEILVEHWPVGR
jgi:predicted nucleic acid-binding protein